MSDFVTETVLKRDVFSETHKGHLAGEPARPVIRRIVSAAPWWSRPLAWVLARHPNTVVIPGTTREAHLVENCGADAIRLDAATIRRLDAVFPPGKASGARYPPATQVENDTEEFGQSA